MTNSKLLLTFFQFTLVLSVLGLAYTCSLTLDYYKTSCPSAKYIAKAITKKYISRDPTLAASLLRLHFHDCFVRGCDGSVLLNSTKNNTAEREHTPTLALEVFKSLISVKKALEKKCPGVVSCADLLALVARDAVLQIGGPSWPVPLGRRDGRVSIASEANDNLPSLIST
ncbi:unnamed protein product [Thlaspi arvense]|uniref:peroxidase n=1 Tax=Thlaspi arvense TaxID=13288 RepID=A0AAU9REV6_THLAR|nr:unnamed protein product [Thlaspi arvense]